MRIIGEKNVGPVGRLVGEASCMIWIGRVDSSPDKLCSSEYIVLHAYHRFWEAQETWRVILLLIRGIETLRGRAIASQRTFKTPMGLLCLSGNPAGRVMGVDWIDEGWL